MSQADAGRVTVIMPTWNNGRYIREALESIQAQTVAPLEVLVIDDGSTDDTEAIVRALNHPRVEYVRQAHGGLCRARNNGLARARGEFVTYLDADDRWRPTMLERQIEILSSDPTLICSISNFVRFVHATGEFLADQFSFCPEFKQIATKPLPVPHAFRIEEDPFAAIVQFGEHPTWMCSMLFRRSMIADLTFDESFPLAEDTHYSMFVFLRGAVAFYTEPLLEMRRHGSNMTSDYDKIEVHRVRALQELTRIIPDGPRRAALNARLIRAHITAARLFARSGERRKSLAQFAGMVGVPGSYGRKVKGSVRLALDLLGAGKPARAG